MRSVLGSTISAIRSIFQPPQNAIELPQLPHSLDSTWYPPKYNPINNWTQVHNGSGVFGFIFNSSDLPDGVRYGTYNWCNMPHVRPQEYPKPPDEYKLKYVEIIHRHHKRTPYAANAFPAETQSWGCDEIELFYYSDMHHLPSAHTYRSLYQSPLNIFSSPGFSGSCQFPQITAGGLTDSHYHGYDLHAVYGSLIGSLPPDLEAQPAELLEDHLKDLDLSPSLSIRATNNPITSQVASQVLAGMRLDGKSIPLLVQPPPIDTLEPNYPCPSAEGLRTQHGPTSNSEIWSAHRRASADLFDSLSSVSGITRNDTDWHTTWDHYYDNLSARLCHALPLPCSPTNQSNCVTLTQAESVFRLGQWEYSALYRDHEWGFRYSIGKIGGLIAETALYLQEAATKRSSIRWRHNVAHDGTIAMLLSVLQVDVMVWPGMGAEIVWELYESSGKHFVRVLWSGQVLRSSHPALGAMDMLPLETVLAYLDTLVGPRGQHLASICGLR